MKNSCVFLFMAAIVFSAALSFSQTPVPGGAVNGTWTASGSPYYIMGEISLAAGQALVIEPGVWVEFQGHFKFNVQGSLMALGTLTDTIMFTINDSTGWSNINTDEGGWHGIRFNNIIPGNDSSRLSHCIFAFGKAVGIANEDRSGGAVAVHEYNDLTISNCVFLYNSAFENGGAVALSNSGVILKENNFWHCRAYNGGAIAVSNASPAINRSFFVDNHAENSGGAISLYSNSNCYIRTNLFAGNFATYGGAIQLEYNCSPVIQNNLIYSNVAYEEGGGVDLENNCQASFINNTIVGNYALFGGGIDVEVNTSPVFQNTIIRGNSAFVDGPQIHLFSEDSDPDFYYCDIEGGTDSIGLWYGGSIYLNYTGIYENNIDLDPEFIDQGFYRYLLEDESPCIDAGDPDEQYNDIEDTEIPGYALFPSKGTLRNDMGVYGGLYPISYEILTMLEEHSDNQITGFCCYPNPANSISHFTFHISQFQYVTLKIFDFFGRQVATLMEEQIQPGEHFVDFDTRILRPGTYFCVLEAEQHRYTRPFLVVNR